MRALEAAAWLVAASVLVVVPDGFVRFVFPKLVVLGIALAVVALARSRTRPSNAVVVLSAVGVGWYVAAAVLSPTPVASLVGRWPRYEGLPMLLVYVGVLWLGARLARLRDERPSGVQAPVAALAVVLAALSVLERVGVSPLAESEVERAGTVLGNAADQGTVGALCALVLLPSAVGPASPDPDRRGPDPRWLAATGLAAGVVTVLASQARSAVVALLLGAVVVIALGLTRHRWILLAGAGVVGVGSLIAIPRWSDGSTVSGRAVLWRDSLDLAGDGLLAGIGPSRYMDAIGAAHGADWVREVGVANPPDSPHNVLLLLLLVGGIPLLVIGVTLAAAALREVVALARDTGQPEPARRLGIGLAAASAAFGVMLLGNVLLPGTICFALTLVGLAIGAEHDPPGRLREIRFPRIAIVGGALVVVLGIYGCVAERALDDGLEQVAAGEVDAAQASFERAQAFRPADGDICMLAAQAFAARAAETGDRFVARGAVEWSDCSLERTPDALASGLARSLALIVLDQPADAVMLLDRLAVSDPTAPEVFEQRALARAALGQIDLAEADRSRAAAIRDGRLP